MRYLISVLLAALLISITACASNPNQPDQQASAQGEETEMRCEKRAHSGSRLGVRKCRRVKVSAEEGG